MRSIGVAIISAASDVGSGAELVAVLVADAKLLAPKLLRTSERSVRSMVEALSKLPEVQALVGEIGDGVVEEGEGLIGR